MGRGCRTPDNTPNQQGQRSHSSRERNQATLIRTGSESDLVGDVVAPRRQK
ncbi:hypothetical protein [Synechococcus sp. MU1625]|uniref:hypothetical protein n=1 Tax=Synechococcus sp. MU1625 TaxID=2508347 RepID=UPI001CF84DE2|nr:hypothetical protein [Synechococcus sp. MU1625]